jgi:hypothetical protein
MRKLPVEEAEEIDISPANAVFMETKKAVIKLRPVVDRDILHETNPP